MKEMKAEVKRLTDLVLVLTMKMNESKDEKKADDKDNDERGSFEGDEKRIKSLKAAHSKDTPTPETYDMDPKGYEEWVEIFGSMMAAIDEQWDIILQKAQGKKSERPWTARQVVEICDELKMDQAAFDAMNRQLYTNLLAYTTGTARAKTMSNKRELALESFRYITEN